MQGRERAYQRNAEEGRSPGPRRRSLPTSVTCALGSPHQPSSQQVLQPGLEDGVPRPPQH